MVDDEEPDGGDMQDVKEEPSGDISKAVFKTNNIHYFRDRLNHNMKAFLDVLFWFINQVPWLPGEL